MCIVFSEFNLIKRIWNWIEVTFFTIEVSSRYLYPLTITQVSTQVVQIFDEIRTHRCTNIISLFSLYCTTHCRYISLKQMYKCSHAFKYLNITLSSNENICALQCTTLGPASCIYLIHIWHIPTYTIYYGSTFSI